MTDNVRNLLKDVLKNISYPARSGKKGFYETEKLEKIDEYLKSHSMYKLIHSNRHIRIYGMGKDKPKNPIVFTSHADIVKGIKNVYADTDKDIYKGTFDNLATNAAFVCMMSLLDKGYDNVYFCFTAEEESGKCTGADEAVRYFGKDALYIAADVTYEGYKANDVISIEGMSCDKALTNKIYSAFLKGEGNEDSFCIAKKEYGSYVPISGKRIASDYTDFDESAFYAKKGMDAMSLCIPSEGNMHSDKGLYIKENAFIGYILSVKLFLDAYLNKDMEPSLIKEKDKLIKEMRDRYKEKKSKKEVMRYDGYYFGDGIDEWENSCDTYEDMLFEELTDMAYEYDDKNAFISDMVEYYGMGEDNIDRDFLESLGMIFDETQEQKEYYEGDRCYSPENYFLGEDLSDIDL